MKQTYSTLRMKVIYCNTTDVITSSVIGEDNVGLTNGNWEGFFA